MRRSQENNPLEPACDRETVTRICPGFQLLDSWYLSCQLLVIQKRSRDVPAFNMTTTMKTKNSCQETSSEKLMSIQKLGNDETSGQQLGAHIGITSLKPETNGESKILLINVQDVWKQELTLTNLWSLLLQGLKHLPSYSSSFN